MAATDPVSDAPISEQAAISVQPPLPNRTLFDSLVDAAAWRYMEMPSEWGGQPIELIADAPIWWMCVGGTKAAPSPVPLETTTATTPAELSAAGAEKIPGRLPADTPRFFVAHPDRMVIAFKGVSAGTDIRVTRT